MTKFKNHQKVAKPQILAHSYFVIAWQLPKEENRTPESKQRKRKNLV